MPNTVRIANVAVHGSGYSRPQAPPQTSHPMSLPETPTTKD
jgi:hypothetical protein